MWTYQEGYIKLIFWNQAIVKEIKEDLSKRKDVPSVDRKIRDNTNDSKVQIHLQIQCNPFQSSPDIFA